MVFELNFSLHKVIEQSMSAPRKRSELEAAIKKYEGYLAQGEQALNALFVEWQQGYDPRLSAAEQSARDAKFEKEATELEDAAVGVRKIISQMRQEADRPPTPPPKKKAPPGPRRKRKAGEGKDEKKSDKEQLSEEAKEVAKEWNQKLNEKFLKDGRMLEIAKAGGLSLSKKEEKELRLYQEYMRQQRMKETGMTREQLMQEEESEYLQKLMGGMEQQAIHESKMGMPVGQVLDLKAGRVRDRVVFIRKLPSGRLVVVDNNNKLHRVDPNKEGLQIIPLAGRVTDVSDLLEQAAKVPDVKPAPRKRSRSRSPGAPRKRSRTRSRSRGRSPSPRPPSRSRSPSPIIRRKKKKKRSRTRSRSRSRSHETDEPGEWRARRRRRRCRSCHRFHR